MIEIYYPGVPRMLFDPAQYATFTKKHSLGSDWPANCMCPSPFRMQATKELLYYYHACNVVKKGSTDIPHGFTANINAVEHVLYMLDDSIGLDQGGAVLDLCSGVGTLATPIANFFDPVITVEANPHFVGLYKDYLATHSTKGRVQPEIGDVANVHGTVQQVSAHSNQYRAIVLNPPYQNPSLVIQCFEIAATCNPDVIIAIVPLDVLAEVSGPYCWRRDEDPATKKPRSEYFQVRNEVAYLRGLRNHWKSIAVLPHFRQDNTAQIATMMFRR